MYFGGGVCATRTTHSDTRHLILSCFITEPVNRLGVIVWEFRFWTNHGPDLVQDFGFVKMDPGRGEEKRREEPRVPGFKQYVPYSNVSFFFSSNTLIICVCYLFQTWRKGNGLAGSSKRLFNSVGFMFLLFWVFVVGRSACVRPSSFCFCLFPLVEKVKTHKKTNNNQVPKHVPFLYLICNLIFNSINITIYC